MSEPARAAEVADEIKSKRRGRPPSQKSTPEQREKWRAKKRVTRAPEPEPEERPPYEADEASIVMSSVLGKTLWDLSRIFSHRRSLTDEEARRLGEALDPVLYRWIPVLDDWKAEAGLVMVVWQLWSATKPPTDEHNGAEAASVSQVRDVSPGEPGANGG